MNDNVPAAGSPELDPKIATDWEAVLKRLADLNSRSGGDMRRRAILERLRKHAA